MSISMGPVVISEGNTFVGRASANTLNGGYLNISADEIREIESNLEQVRLSEEMRRTAVQRVYEEGGRGVTRSTDIIGVSSSQLDNIIRSVIQASLDIKFEFIKEGSSVTATVSLFIKGQDKPICSESDFIDLDD